MTEHGSPERGGRIVVRVDPDLEDLVPGFLENRRRDIEAMREALERGDLESVRSLAHTMKGVGGGYGFDAVTEIGRRIEDAAATGDAPGIDRGMKELSAYLDRVEVVFE